MEYKHEESKQLVDELKLLGYSEGEFVQFIPVNRKPNANDIKFIIQQLIREESYKKLSEILK